MSSHDPRRQPHGTPIQPGYPPTGPQYPPPNPQAVHPQYAYPAQPPGANSGPYSPAQHAPAPPYGYGGSVPQHPQPPAAVPYANQGASVPGQQPAPQPFFPPNQAQHSYPPPAPSAYGNVAYPTQSNVAGNAAYPNAPSQPYPAQSGPVGHVPSAGAPVPVNTPTARALPNRPLPVSTPVQPASFGSEGARPNAAVPISTKDRATTSKPNQPAFTSPATNSPRPASGSRPVPMGAAGAMQSAPSPATAARSAARPILATAASTANRPIPAAANALGLRSEPADGEETQDDVAEKAVRSAPPWLVSLVVHMVVLIVLALVTVLSQGNKLIEIDAVFAETEGVQLIDDTLQMASLDEIEIADPVLSEDLVPVMDPLAAPPDIPELVIDATSSSSMIEAPSIGLALSGREAGMKKALLGAYGGTATTEESVKRGLEWLKRNQQKSGMWSLTGPYSSPALTENAEAATAMALLAFQGAGHTHQTGEHKEVVRKGWEALLKSQDADGSFFHAGNYHHRLYTQAQCTIAICELYGMTHDEKFREPAQRSLDYAIKSQAPEGGWRYVPREDSDTSVTGWFVMALQSARMAGLQVPSPNLDEISKFLDSVTPDEGIHYSYMPGEGTTNVMTAEALLCRQYLGWAHDDPRLRQGVDYLHGYPIDYKDANVYYWYYATQVMHHMDDEDWKRWNQVMREAVPAQQVKTGAESGSWNPSDDRWGAGHAGRLFTTCLSIYMLEVYYRHLPIYKHRL